MRCILEGHSFERITGRGDYFRETFDICVHCGNTYKVDGNGKRAAEAQLMPPPAQHFPLTRR